MQQGVLTAFRPRRSMRRLQCVGELPAPSIDAREETSLQAFCLVGGFIGRHHRCCHPGSRYTAEDGSDGIRLQTRTVPSRAEGFPTEAGL